MHIICKKNKGKTTTTNSTSCIQLFEGILKAHTHTYTNALVPAPTRMLHNLCLSYACGCVCMCVGANGVACFVWNAMHVS